MIKIVYNSSYLSIEMFCLPASRYEIVTNSIFACLTVKFSSETQLCRVISLNFFPIERKLQKLSNEETGDSRVPGFDFYKHINKKWS